MATTTAGTTPTGITTRSNPALYWGIGIVLAIALIAFLLMRNQGAENVPMSVTPSATDTTIGTGTGTDTGEGAARSTTEGDTGPTTETNSNINNMNNNNRDTSTGTSGQ